MFESVFQHTGKSVRRLSLVQYLLFEKRFIFLQMSIGLVFIYCGFALIGDKVIASMCMLFGCWLTISWKQIAYHKADTIISHGGEIPKTVYHFRKELVTITCGKNEIQLPYGKIIRLAEDEAYDYLFISSKSAYMLKKREQDEIAFKEFLSRNTSQTWIHVTSLLSMTFRLKHGIQ